MRTLETTSKGRSAARRSSQAPIGLPEIRDVVKQIAAQISPQRVILFGSHASRRASRDSDVDLLVVTDRPTGPDASLNLRRKIQYSFPLDIVIFDAARITRRIEAGDFFLQDAVEHGKVLYEAVDR